MGPELRSWQSQDAGSLYHGVAVAEPNNAER